MALKLLMQPAALSHGSKLWPSGLALPFVCAFIFSYTKPFSRYNRHKIRPEQNSKPLVKQRCRLGGAEAAAVAAAPPGLSQLLRQPPNDVQVVSQRVFW
jgi:hypothetical protein